jgi:chemotaxis protein histidine kinase CheA
MLVMTLVRSTTEKDKTPVKHIDISVKREGEKLVIVVEDDGDGIPIEEHPTEKVYVLR